MSKPRVADGASATLDYLMGGKLIIRQPVTGHRGGTDTMLLAAAAPATSGLLLDLGAGVGTAGLAVALRGGCEHLVLVELQTELAALAAENIALNGLGTIARSLCADGLTASGRRTAGLKNGMADVLIANPPYLSGARSQTSPDPSRALAHSLGAGGIDDWLRAASALLHPDGRLAMIYRADGLKEILDACDRRFGGIEVFPVHPREGEAAHRIILRAIRGSRAPLSIRPPVVLHGEGGGFTPFAEALHTGAATLI